MKALELFNSGQLHEAIQAAIEDVKSNPADSSKRMVFSELLCFTGDFERADRQLETVFLQSPELSLPTAVGRQLVRAATTRQRVFFDGALPEFVAPMDPVLNSQLRLLTLYRAGEFGQADEVLETQIEPYCGALKGTCDDKAFSEFRDLDDTTAACLEVLTTAGKYYWFAWDRLETVDFYPVKRPLDLLWRPAHISVRQGPDADVFIPVRYPSTVEDDGDAALLSHATDWREHAAELAVGVGQRIFSADINDEGEVAILAIESLAFAQPESAESEAVSGDEMETDFDATN